ncbi:mutator MutT protein [Psychromonas sp. CNPT3]|uniref:8-oxo-dGTP diphosphatase MutT n=1 Tax=Psychromonas sp. CNPT3 TaxID=314282 RepID=UPI00006E42B2|nr:8-oxo-dGTP diphosphatase MutT [Psychromonas sp. CNPT3]AGH80651.1 mutator MutT protein [Psychromonas sp. CNPT3]
MKIIEISIGIVKNQKAQYLLSLRGLTRHQGGKWEFPGGKVEPLESPAQAMCRELEEEVGLVAIDYHLLEHVYFDYGDRQLNLYFYLVEKYRGEVCSHLDQEVRWVSASGLSEYDFPEANKSVLEKLN